MSGEKWPLWGATREAEAPLSVLGSLEEGSPEPQTSDLASAIPLLPDASGRPFLIGSSSQCDVLLADREGGAANPVKATIYHTSEGWIVVDGSVQADGTITPGGLGLFVNGARVQDYASIAQDDILRIGRTPYQFFDPLKRQAEAAKAEGLELGSSWLHFRESDGSLVATASYRGLIDKYNENQDRMAFRRSSGEGLTIAAIDGMGGHDSGERAAEIGRRAFYEAVDSGLSLERVIEHMNADMFRDNRDRGTRGGAVVAAVRLENDGLLEVRTVGDAEVLVMSLPAAERGALSADELRIDYWSTRPTQTQAATYPISTLPDGRIELGHERIVRLDPASNVVDTAAGMRPSTREMQTLDRFETVAGRIYLVIPMTDGLTEQYLSHEEILEIVRDHLKRTGDIAPEAVRNALLRDALLRCGLCRMCNREGRSIDLTPARVRQVAREVAAELGEEGGPDPEANWRYQSRSEEGSELHYFLVPFSGSAYLIKGADSEGQGWMPDPHVVDPSSGNLKFNPAHVYHPSVLGRFKQDNISLGVVVFERKAD